MQAGEQARKEAAWVTWNAEVEAFEKLWRERCFMSLNGEQLQKFWWASWSSHEKWLLNPNFPFLPLVEKMVQNIVNKTQVSEAILIFSCLWNKGTGSLCFTGHSEICALHNISLGDRSVFRAATEFSGKFLKRREEENLQSPMLVLQILCCTSKTLFKLKLN